MTRDLLYLLGSWLLVGAAIGSASTYWYMDRKYGKQVEKACRVVRRINVRHSLN